VLEGWLEAAKAAKEAAAEAQENEGPVRVIFDTDIGTDGMLSVLCAPCAVVMRATHLPSAGVGGAVDDALALLMLLHLPKEDVELLGITTTYGYTQVHCVAGWDRTSSFGLCAHPSHMWCACGRACAMWGHHACGEQVRARVAQEIVTAYERGQATRTPDEVGKAEKNESESEDEDDEAEACEEARELQPKTLSQIPVIAGRGVELGCVHDRVRVRVQHILR
jgi:hypothetical protein